MEAPHENTASSRKKTCTLSGSLVCTVYRAPPKYRWFRALQPDAARDAAWLWINTRSFKHLSLLLDGSKTTAISPGALIQLQPFSSSCARGAPPWTVQRRAPGGPRYCTLGSDQGTEKRTVFSGSIMNPCCKTIIFGCVCASCSDSGWALSCCSSPRPDQCCFESFGSAAQERLVVIDRHRL